MLVDLSVGVRVGVPPLSTKETAIPLGYRKGLGKLLGSKPKSVRTELDNKAGSISLAELGNCTTPVDEEEPTDGF